MQASIRFKILIFKVQDFGNFELHPCRHKRYFGILVFRNLRKWVQNYQKPTSTKPSARSHSATDTYKPNKSFDDAANSGKQFRDKQKLKQQQYFAQQNQNEFQEYLQFKDSKTRGREAREQRRQGSESPRKDAYQKGGYSNNQGYSPSFRQDKNKQFQILVSTISVFQIIFD